MKGGEGGKGYTGSGVQEDEAFVFLIEFLFVFVFVFVFVIGKGRKTSQRKGRQIMEWRQMKHLYL